MRVPRVPIERRETKEYPAGRGPPRTKPYYSEIYPANWARATFGV
jgi:hypothetical protein